MKVKNKRIVRKSKIQFKIGDKIKQGYIYDNCELNNMDALIKEIRWIKYYPNRDYSIIHYRPQATLLYDNGIINYALIDTCGCGILSPYELVSN